ncbi:cadherin repeat domain-containing protein [Flavobacterium microcysteis]|uniref:Carboxypeptidase regulatory-like domain-containing protein n=1 Tax=Flavobacterium microcysteis TaxID=2596891 RepID=A0A501Q3N9_9FLAO|nr:hypothetical protein [Flavobacterium microcysteis]TPD66952.1 hypothetical protein FJA49_11765 [Flavobacterium microcysteis]
MKKLLLITALFFAFFASAQVPQGISYQAIALNSSGAPIVNSNVGIRLSVLDNTATGTVLYAETHTKTTNAQGLFATIIGQGSATTGTFSAINWATNPKFLKVELDVAGGTNYVLTGTTQLLSVPYALAAKGLALQAGEGIKLISPNGTPYQLTVNDNGQLSLPTSENNSNIPNQLYMYGTFNSFNPTSALLMRSTSSAFSGYKYLTAGTQIKFTSSNSANGAVYGINGIQDLTLNANAYTIPSNGFYFIQIATYGSLPFSIVSIAPSVVINFGSTSRNMTYNVGTNTLTTTVTGITNSDSFYFNIPSSNGSQRFGDNLADGTIDEDGSSISFPGATATPRNYKIDLVLNFNGSGTYTITPQ